MPWLFAFIAWMFSGNHLQMFGSNLVCYWCWIQQWVKVCPPLFFFSVFRALDSGCENVHTCTAGDFWAYSIWDLMCRVFIFTKRSRRKLNCTQLTNAPCSGAMQQSQKSTLTQTRKVAGTLRWVSASFENPECDWHCFTSRSKSYFFWILLFFISI